MNKREREQARLRAIAAQQKKQAGTPTNILNPQIAKQERITFSFINIDLKRGKFTCTVGDGQHFLNIFDNLKKHSGYDIQNVGTRKNSHFLPDDQIGGHALQDLLTLSGGNKLFQMGSKQQPERIVGYFESNRSNVFNVCFFDLKHQLSGA